MKDHFNVMYPSDKLRALLSTVRERITERYAKDRDEWVRLAKERDTKNIWYRWWYGNLWGEVVRVDNSYDRKISSIGEMLIAAEVVESVSISSEAFKWINDHYNGYWCW